MKNLVYIVLVSLFAVLASTVGIAEHASAASEIKHAAVEHSGPQSTNCATVCLSGPAQGKKDELSAQDEEDDDQPAPPHYLQLTTFDIHQLHIGQSIPPGIEVDDKVPKYRLCCVIRR